MKNILDYMRGYQQGYADANFRVRYRTRFGARHRMMVLVPGDAFSDDAESGYRDGWIDQRRNATVG